MKEELEKIIAQRKEESEQHYVDSSIRAEALKRLEYLEELYEALYGY